MRQRIVILSDTHLGRQGASAISATALRPLWQDCDRLIINGDVAEVHHARYQSAACRETIALHEMCEQDEVELTLISGNHDPYISDIRHLHLAGGQVFVTHGDALHESIAPWSPVAARLREAHAEAIEKIHQFPPVTLESRLMAAQHASHSEWSGDQTDHGGAMSILARPWLVWQVLRYWRRIPTLAAEFAATHVPKAEYVIIGHTHRPCIHVINDRTIINTGCYGFPGSPRAVTLEGHDLRVYKVERRGNEYRLAKKPLRVFDLSMPASLQIAA